MVTLYGIKNCDTMKKACNWLQQHDITYTLVDYKQQPPSSAQLHDWLAQFGAARLLNKRGTTYRKLDEASKAEIEDNADSLVAMLQAQPSMIKRPILQGDNFQLIGFQVEEYEQHLT